MTSYEKALAEYKANPANARRKGTATHYANGKPKITGKTQKQIKEGQKSGSLNSSGKPVSHQGLMNYKTPTVTPVPHQKREDWAGDVHKARIKNQKFSSKHYTDKGYREDYR